MQTLHLPPPRPALTGIALAVALALLPALPAAAHDQLASASPAAGSTVTAATSVDLTFDAAVLELGGGRNTITVTGDGGRHFETACAAIGGTRMSVPVALGGAGTYTVTWRAVSSDGHPVGDDYTFDYRPASGTSAAAGTTASPCADAAAAAATSAGLPVGALIAGGVSALVLLAVLAVVLVVVLRRREQEADR